MKLFKKENRFIKIYGSDNEPSVISIKNINTIKFDIFMINMKNEIFYYVPINELKLSLNAIIICKT